MPRKAAIPAVPVAVVAVEVTDVPGETVEVGEAVEVAIEVAGD